MSQSIKIIPQELNDAAIFLRNRLEAITQEVSALKRKIDDVTSRWEGHAQQSFVEQFETSLYPVLRDTLPQVVNGIAGGMDASANALRETDEALKKAMKQ